MNSEWRSPDSYEKELIAKWIRISMRDLRRELRPAIIFLLIVLSFALIGIVFLTLGGYMKLEKLLSSLYKSLQFRLSLFLLPFAVFGFFLCLIKQLRGDYQIRIVEVVSTFQHDKNGNFVTVNTASGEIMEISVSKSIFEAAKQGTPGFALRRKKTDLSKKAAGLLSKFLNPNSGFEFYPAQRTDM